MKTTIPDDPLWIGLFISIVSITFGFVFYQFFHAELLRNSFKKQGIRRGSPKEVTLKRISGVLLFGILPAAAFSVFSDPAELLRFMGPLTLKTLWFYLPIATLIVLVNYYTAGGIKNLEMYPEMRIHPWTPRLLVLSAGGWIAYLFAYEFVFRAMLFYTSLELLGFWPAVFLNTGLYALVHLPKNYRETFGSMYYGFIICALVIYTGSFWIAFFLHLTLALSNEWFSVYEFSKPDEAP